MMRGFPASTTRRCAERTPHEIAGFGRRSQREAAAGHRVAREPQVCGATSELPATGSTKARSAGVVRRRRKVQRFCGGAARLGQRDLLYHSRRTPSSLTRPAARVVSEGSGSSKTRLTGRNLLGTVIARG